MPYCSQCGHKLNENAIYCEECGCKVDTNNKSNKNTPIIEDSKNKAETVGNTFNNTIHDVKKDVQNSNFDFSNLNFATIGKFSVVGLVLALIIGIILFALTWGTVSLSYYHGTDTGLTGLSFILGVIISVGLLSAHMKYKTEAIVMGLVVGLLTGLFESSIVYMFMGRQMGFWFTTFIGNQALILVIVGVIVAYVGNTYLKDKIHLKIITKYLGE